MTSAIVPTNPVQGNATTSSLRANFLAAHDEINVLQRMSTEVKITGGSNGVLYTATFTDAVVLGEGVRVSVEINTANTNTAPTLNANNTGNKTIVRQDGSALVAGDLKKGQYVDLIYAASGGATGTIQDKWVWLNSPYAQLITSLKQDIAANIYPVGSIFTTTANYSAADNGEAVAIALGMASTVQWSRFAQGRTIVGADLGTTINSASSSSNVVTLVVTSHGLSAGDSITVSGFTNDTDANGSFTVDSTTSTNIVYTASNVSDGSLTGSNLLVINNAFDAGDTGGASNHRLSQAEMKHNHQWNKTESDGGASDNFIEMDRVSNSLEDSTFDESGDKLLYTDQFEMRQNTFTSANRGLTDGTVTPHNNLQPYITTYIWKRTA